MGLFSGMSDGAGYGVMGLSQLGAGYLQSQAMKKAASQQYALGQAQLEYQKSRDAIADRRYTEGQQASADQSRRMQEGFASAFGTAQPNQQGLAGQYAPVPAPTYV
jgi:hypothetical protein